MYNYLEVYPKENLYADHSDVTSGGDYEIFSARVLGRGIKTVAGPEISAQIIEILNRESDQKGHLKFIQQMQSGSFYAESTIPKDIEMLKAVSQGVAD
jgi:hypothetical protein